MSGLVGILRYCPCGWLESDCQHQQDRDEDSQAHQDRLDEIEAELVQTAPQADAVGGGE